MRLLLLIGISVIMGFTTVFIGSSTDQNRIVAFFFGFGAALSLVGFIAGWILMVFFSIRCATNLSLLGWHKVFAKDRNRGSYSRGDASLSEEDEIEARYNRLILDGFCGVLVVGTLMYGLVQVSKQVGLEW